MLPTCERVASSPTTFPGDHQSSNGDVQKLVRSVVFYKLHPVLPKRSDLFCSEHKCMACTPWSGENRTLSLHVSPAKACQRSYYAGMELLKLKYHTGIYIF